MTDMYCCMGFVIADYIKSLKSAVKQEEKSSTGESKVLCGADSEECTKMETNKVAMIANDTEGLAPEGSVDDKGEVDTMLSKEETKNMLIKRKNMVHRADKLSHYSDHPMNTFDFMRDWWLITNGLKGFNLNDNDTSTFFKPITRTDYRNAIDALLRLQVVYKLDIADMIRGIINGHQGKPLNSNDILDIIESAIANSYFHTALEWLKHADKDSNHYDKTYKILALIGKRNYKAAEGLLKKLEKKSKNISLIGGVKDIFVDSTNGASKYKEEYTLKALFTGILKNVSDENNTTIINKMIFANQRMDLERYGALCRSEQVHEYLGDGNNYDKASNKLFCTYWTGAAPYVRIAVEQRSKQPPIWMLYDIVSFIHINTSCKIPCKSTCATSIGKAVGWDFQ